MLFALAGLVVDGSSLFVDHRTAQNAADASALAAADELGPASDPACASDPTCIAGLKTKVAAVAQTYVGKNGLSTATFHECAPAPASDTDCYAYPYHGDITKVEVRVHKTGSGFFSRVMGVSIFTSTARAVAVAKPSVIVHPGIPLAIFAYTHHGTDPCNGQDANGVPYGITIEGNPTDNIDAVLSNSGVTMNSKGNVSWAGYGAPPQNCPRAGSKPGNVGTWAQQPSVLDWPRTFDRAAICTGHDSAAAVNLNSPPDGIYCSQVKITLTHMSGDHNLTLVAPIVNFPNGVGNNNYTLSPYNTGLDAANQDLVLWQYGDGQSFDMGGNNSAFNGIVWIENGSLSYDGNSGVTGFYEAQNVWVKGNSYVMHGSGPATPPTTEITGATASLDE